MVPVSVPVVEVDVGVGLATLELVLVEVLVSGFVVLLEAEDLDEEDVGNLLPKEDIPVMVDDEDGFLVEPGAVVPPLLLLREAAVVGGARFVVLDEDCCSKIVSKGSARIFREMGVPFVRRLALLVDELLFLVEDEDDLVPFDEDDFLSSFTVVLVGSTLF